MVCHQTIRSLEVDAGEEDEGDAEEEEAGGAGSGDAGGGERSRRFVDGVFFDGVGETLIREGEE